MILSDADIAGRVYKKGINYIQSTQCQFMDEHYSDLLINPWESEKGIFNGMSYGLSCAGYDVRIKQDVTLPPGAFALASIMEYMEIPTDLAAELKDKSSMARQGLSVFNTIIEPGWKGWLTVELANQSKEIIFIPQGSPIGQVVFKQMSGHARKPYQGKYQNQANEPVPYINEKPPETAHTAPT